MSDVIILIIIISVIFWIICGFLSMDLHKKKGYNGGFGVGFLLGFIGLIYSAGLPDINDKKVKKNEKNELVIVANAVTNAESDPETNTSNLANIDECPNCFSKITPNDSQCPNCGFKLK